MLLKWKIFNVVNIMLTLIVISFVGMLVYRLMESYSAISIVQKQPGIFLLVFGSLFSILAFSIFNIAIVNAQTLDKQVSRSRSVGYTIAYLLSIIANLFYLVVTMSLIYQSSKTISLRTVDHILIALIIFVLIAGIYNLVLSFQLRQQIKFAYLDLQQENLDQIGQEQTTGNAY